VLFSLEWLRQYVDLPEAAQAIAETLTSVGLAVEGIERRSDDVLLDVDVTTNRAVAMNHFGIARELAVKLDRRLSSPAGDLAESGADTRADVTITLEDPRCLRYAARVVRGVRVGPSPEWLRRRLESIGHRPINNVVDVTNFVLWETGQPLHAFDLDKLRRLQGGGQSEVRVRAARPGEKVVTLDGVERALAPGMLVIADARRVIALAGVMGGLDTEVDGETRNVLLESAHFDRQAVRAVTSALAMTTDASHRFERGADPGGCAAAAARAAQLLAELAGGEVAPAPIDERSPWPATWPPRGELELSRLSALAGLDIPAAEVERILPGLGFALESRGADRWLVTVPSWRYYDFPAMAESLRGPEGENVEEADLFEEVIRQVGFDAVPAALPAIAGPDAGANPGHARRGRVRDVLAAAGFAEAIHYAFHSEAADRQFDWQGAAVPPLRLVNPLSVDYVAMRRSLLPNLVEGARLNFRRGAAASRLFEIGHLFPGGEASEQDALALVASGVPGSEWERASKIDLFDLKGAVESLGEALGVALEFRAVAVTGLVAGTAAQILLRGSVVGVLGQVSGDDAAPLFAAELLLEAFPAQRPVETVRVPSRFPGIAMDLTFTHALSVEWAEIAAAVREQAPADLESFGLRVRYQGEGVPAGAVNTTLAFYYASAERSLTQAEVNERHLAVREVLERRFGWREPR
jgi:phenylalanyl-tRNA synthetase beta chain